MKSCIGVNYELRDSYIRVLASARSIASVYVLCLSLRRCLKKSSLVLSAFIRLRNSDGDISSVLAATGSSENALLTSLSSLDSVQGASFALHIYQLE